MRSKKVLLTLALMLLIASGLGLYLFGGPNHFVEVPLPQQSLAHLRSTAGNASWRALPSDTAFEYLYWWPQIDRPNRNKMEVAVAYRSASEVVVTIIDNDTQDDSVFRTCDRITMHLEGDIWLPARHQRAQQGRGHIGWTTEPTL
jgi:hypothetical protein